MAAEFRAFVKLYLRGAVLDVGCGPQPVPSYLDGYPLDRIAGIDPLPPTEGHPFTFVQTVAEFLPWDDKTFSVVVVATSLDHVLLPDRRWPSVTACCGTTATCWSGWRTSPAP